MNGIECTSERDLGVNESKMFNIKPENWDKMFTGFLQ